jgi:hypothetical protein
MICSILLADIFLIILKSEMKKIKFKFFEELFKSTISQDIREYITALINQAKKHKCLGATNINNVIVLAQPDSDPELLFRDQQRSQMNLMPSKIVGPYPEKELSKKNLRAYKSWYVMNH